MPAIGPPTFPSALADLGVTLAIEKSEIATNLNVSMLSSLLIGIYTVIYGGTIYLYVTKKGSISSKNYLVPSAVTTLYLCNLGQFAIQWRLTTYYFIDNGASRDSVYLSILNFLPGPLEFLNILFLITLVVSDGLLIWRCFIVWGRSFRVISLPMLLVLAEAALLLTQIIGYATPDTASLHIISKTAAAGYIMAAFTTLLTTALIAYRIFPFTTHKGLSPKKFRHALDIVVQSGAVSSLTLLTYGISVIVGNTPSDVERYEFSVWMKSFMFVISGISTTVMVARVSLLNDNSPSSISTKISGLQFLPSSRKSYESSEDGKYLDS